MAQSTDQALITCKDISLGYDCIPVVEHLDFIVQEGAFLCIVGENGAGKSTLLKTLLGLIPPLKGRLQFSDNLKQTEIGYLPQQTSIQKDFPASVKEVVQSGCLNRCGMRPFFNSEEKQLAFSSLEKLGIEKLRARSYRDLSGGQQQKVLLARALCATRKILLLDEPMASLDPTASKEMYRTLERLNQNDGITIIMISHDVSFAVTYASEVLHLGNQEVLFYGDRNDYLKTTLFDISRETRGS